MPRYRKVHIEKVLKIAESNPDMTVRSIAQQFKLQHNKEITYSQVSNILDNYGDNDILDIKHSRKTSGPRGRDKNKRGLAFCQRIVTLMNLEPDFIKNIIWTGDTVFWSDMFRKKSSNEKWKIVTWAAIYNYEIIGPIFLDAVPNGEQYLKLINKQLPKIIDGISLSDLSKVWFQHDCTPWHTVTPVCERLNELFPDKWIGRNGPIPWPIQTNNLSLVHSYLFHNVKVVYGRKVKNCDEAKLAIINKFNDIKKVLREKPKKFEEIYSKHMKKIVRVADSAIKCEFTNVSVKNGPMEVTEDQDDDPLFQMEKIKVEIKDEIKSESDECDM